MDTFMKILKWIVDLLSLYFKHKDNSIENEREIRRENKEISSQVDRDIDEARDAIENGNDNKLNEILK